MRVLFLTLFIIIFDQITKLFVKGFSIPWLDLKVAGMDYGHRNNVIGDFVQFTFVENPGMAFGIDFGESTKIFLTLFSLIASIGILIYIFKVRNKELSYRIALALILGGAVGNFIDRMFYGVIFDYAPLFYGRVVDFVSIDFFDFTIFGRTYERWPIFNIADAAVSIGVVIIMFFTNVHRDEEKNNNVSLEEGNKSEDLDESLINQADTEEEDATDHRRKADND